MKVLSLKESAQKRCKYACSLFLLSLLDIWFKLQTKNSNKMRGHKGCGLERSDHHTRHDKIMKHYHLFSQGQNQPLHFSPLKT